MQIKRIITAGRDFASQLIPRDFYGIHGGNKNVVTRVARTRVVNNIG